MLLTENKEKKYKKCIESIKNTSKRNKLKLISKLLFESFDSWIFCGFYFQDGNKLFISEYSSDKIPCSPIEFNGVCGTAILKNQILNIDDVNKFEGHIVCDENSKSELCIPFEISGIKYVLDVDSKINSAFCKIDEGYLLKIIREI